MTTPEAFFVRDGALYVPTGLGASPWTGNTIGGVPLAALTTHLMEALPASSPMHTARITIDILGAVPMEPLEGEARIVRDGRRMQFLSVDLRSGGRTWVRASALRMREEETPGGEVPLTCVFPADMSGCQTSPLGRSLVIEPPGRTAGKGSRWIEFLPTPVAGTPLSPLQRVAMLADFGSGISPLYPMSEWTFANVDISIHLTRSPRSNWLLIDAASQSAGNGIGLAQSRLGDRDGMFGNSTQTMFMARR